MRIIRRDPFARGSVVRRQFICIKSCDWCGKQNRSRRYYRGLPGLPFLYCYGWSPDVGQVVWDRKFFCSISCRRSFFDGGTL